MEFEIIKLEDLRESLSNLIMNSNQEFREFKKYISIEITENMFREFKRRQITKEEIEKLVNKSKKKDTDVIKIKNIWNNKEKEIFEAIEKITGIKILTSNIKCYIDPYTNHGFYGENEISIGAYPESEAILLVISHELFHIFYWRKLKEIGIFKKELGKEEDWEWALAEVTVYLLQKEDLLTKFWPNEKIELYPEIKQVYEKVKNLWEKEDFDNYLIKSYRLLNHDKPRNN